MNTYYIDTKLGKDSNKGDIDNPFKTICKFSNVCVPGDTCFIREGVYYETFTSSKSGEKDFPITYQSYQNEKVIISGTKIIDSEWKKLENGIYSTVLNSNLKSLGDGHNQLFFNKEMMIESRFPKINNAFELKRENHITSFNGGIIEEKQDTDNPSKVKVIAYYESNELNDFETKFFNDSYISFVPGKEWWGEVGKITKSTPGRIEFEFTILKHKLIHSTPSENDIFYLWGNYNLLTDEKEWFFDSTNNTLFFKPPTNIEDSIIELKQIPTLFHLSNLSYLNFKDIEIFAGNISFNKSSSYITLDKITSCYGSHNSGVDGWITMPPIYLDGKYNKVINSTIKYSSGPILVHGNNHIIENNVIHDIGYSSKSLSGIQDGGKAFEINICDNTIFNCGGIAISATFKKSKVLHNHIWNVNRLKTDSAAINCYNSGDLQGTIVSHNFVHNIQGKKDTIEHWGGYGIRLDGGGGKKGVSNCKIYNNVVLKTTSNSIGIWGIPDTGDNYNNSFVLVFNNVVDSTILLAEANKSFQGTKITNNVAFNIHSVGYNASEFPNKKPGETFIPFGCTLKNNTFNKNIKLGGIDDEIFILPYSHSFTLFNDSIGYAHLHSGAHLKQHHLNNLKVLQQENDLKFTNIPIGMTFPESIKVKYIKENQLIIQNTCPINYIDFNGQVFAIIKNITNIYSINLTLNDEDFVSFTIIR